MRPDPDLVRRLTVELELSDGTPVLIRPLVPADRDELVRGFERLSAESRYRRFFGGAAKLSASLLAYLTELDYRDHFAFAAFVPEDEGPAGVGVARYIRLREAPDTAEAAVTVIDDYHRRGIGRLLLQALASVAVENGVRTLRFEILPENRPMIDLAATLGARVRTGDTPGVLLGEVDLPSKAEDLQASQVYRVLRQVARDDLHIRGFRHGAPGPRRATPP